MPSRTVFYVVGVGVTKLIAALTFFASLKVVKAYISIAVRMFIIPITLLLDYLFMHEFPNQLQVAGVVLVTLGIVIVSVHTWRTHRQKERQRELLETLHFDHKEE
ncbi:hypothetical protein Bbelb_333750 [Branchiostoma belcheri]|nr:hypothetical protein Bbelb_333750 [Branchiostoma belcheri]